MPLLKKTVKPLLAACLLAAAAVAAAPRVSAVALFEGKAMLLIDGQRRLVKQGEATPEGVRLISSSTRGAVIEFGGQRQTLQLSRTVGGTYAEPAAKIVRLRRDGMGMYMADGAVNGKPVRFLVDTGATFVSISGEEAKRLGIRYEQGQRGQLMSAAGPVSAYKVMLDRVSVGGVELHYVAATVLDGSNPHVPLLGMSFLGRLKMRHEGEAMVLEKVE